MKIEALTGFTMALSALNVARQGISQQEPINC